MPMGGARKKGRWRGPSFIGDGLARTGVGEGAQDGARVLVHDLTKVHGDGEHRYQEKEIDAEQ